MRLRHPLTGRTIDCAPDAARVHQLSGWEPVDEETAAPVRPGPDAPPRKWLAYARQIGLDIDENDVDSLDELVARIDAHRTDHEPMPDRADDLVAWIGQDPDRAQTALDAENQRPHARKTVTDHIDTILNAQEG